MGDADATERWGVPLDYTAKMRKMTCGPWSSAGPMIAVCNSTSLIALAKTKFATREIHNLFTQMHPIGRYGSIALQGEIINRTAYNTL